MLHKIQSVRVGILFIWFSSSFAEGLIKTNKSALGIRSTVIYKKKNYHLPNFHILKLDDIATTALQVEYDKTYMIPYLDIYK